MELVGYLIAGSGKKFRTLTCRYLISHISCLITWDISYLIIIRVKTFIGPIIDSNVYMRATGHNTNGIGVDL